MKRRRKVFEHPTLFISGAVSGRVPLFRVFPAANDIFLEDLDFYRRKYGYLLRAFVIMPDHYHLLVTVKQGTVLSSLLRDFKSQVGRQIVEKLKAASSVNLLRKFELSQARRRPKDPRFRVLQYDNDIVEVFTRKVYLDKLRYVHGNPVAKGLVASPGDWLYSSWQAYQTENAGPIHIDTISALDL